MASKDWKAVVRELYDDVRYDTENFPDESKKTQYFCVITAPREGDDAYLFTAIADTEQEAENQAAHAAILYAQRLESRKVIYVDFSTITIDAIPSSSHRIVAFALKANTTSTEKRNRTLHTRFGSLYTACDKTTLWCLISAELARSRVPVWLISRSEPLKTICQHLPDVQYNETFPQ